MEYIKEQLIDDMLTILFGTEGISSYSMNHIIDMYCWLLTERAYNLSKEKTKNAKYAGCNYWSETALKEYQKNSSKNKYKGLKHEHVVPRCLFRKYLCDLISKYSGKGIDEKKKTEIKKKINKCFIGCVVTFEEAEKIDKLHKNSFPNSIETLSDINEENIWNRYKVVGDIKIKEVEWEFTANKWSILNETEINI
ncbi:MAG: hypothetical protein J6B88_04270 [Clostridia bacterium]|nr:hypothetical protein [Clostridia bacterium]